MHSLPSMINRVRYSLGLVEAFFSLECQPTARSGKPMRAARLLSYELIDYRSSSEGLLSAAG